MSEPNPTYAHEKPANKSSALEQALRELEKAKAALKQIHNMAVEELRRFDDTELQGHMVWQIEADARAALKELDDA